MPILDTDGGRIHYALFGAGPDIVLIHGLGANLAFWQPRLIAGLSARFRVTTYDLSGHGYSEMRRTGYTPAALADDLRALLNHLRIRRPNIVGHSFGGSVALYFSCLAPDRVKTITLADAWVASLQPLPRRTEGHYWDRWRSRIEKLGVDVSDQLPLVAYGLVEELARTNESDLRMLPSAQSAGKWITRRGGRRWRTLLEGTSALTDFKDPSGLTESAIARVECPVLLMYGEHSHCLPTFTRLVQLLPNSKHVIVPNAGHYHPLVAPAAFVNQLTAFIEGYN